MPNPNKDAQEIVDSVKKEAANATGSHSQNDSDEDEETK